MASVMKTSKIDDQNPCRQGNPLDILDRSLYLLNFTPKPRKWIVVVCDDDYTLLQVIWPSHTQYLTAWPGLQYIIYMHVDICKIQGKLSFSSINIKGSSRPNVNKIFEMGTFIHSCNLFKHIRLQVCIIINLLKNESVLLCYTCIWCEEFGIILGN